MFLPVTPREPYGRRFESANNNKANRFAKAIIAILYMTRRRLSSSGRASRSQPVGWDKRSAVPPKDVSFRWWDGVPLVPPYGATGRKTR